MTAWYRSMKANVYHPGEHDRIAAQQGVVSPDIVDSE